MNAETSERGSGKKGSRRSLKVVNLDSKSISTRVTMGLDLSMTGTGLVVLARGRLVRAWHLRTDLEHNKPKKAGESELHNGVFFGSTEARIAYLKHNILRSWEKFGVELTFFEEQAFSRNMAYARQTGEMTGTVRNGLWELEALWDVRTGTALKMYATGDGSATKADMVKAARAFWPECPNDDLADAFHLAKWAAEEYESIVHNA